MVISIHLFNKKEERHIEGKSTTGLRIHKLGIAKPSAIALNSKDDLTTPSSP